MNHRKFLEMLEPETRKECVAIVAVVLIVNTMVLTGVAVLVGARASLTLSLCSLEAFIR